MPREVYPNPAEEPTPRLRLQEGVDFLDHIEIHNRVVKELREHGHDPQIALLCGHNQDDNNGQPRTHITARPLMEVHDALQYAQFTPYAKAIDDAFYKGTPTITAYDSRLMEASIEESNHYHTRDGSSVDTAALLHVELSVW